MLTYLSDRVEDNGMQCRPSLKEISQFKHRSRDMTKLKVMSLEIKKKYTKINSRFEDIKRFDLFLSDQSSTSNIAWEQNGVTS
jgi:hypothetical protein